MTHPFFIKSKDIAAKATKTPYAWIQSNGITHIRAIKPRTQADLLFMYPYKNRHEDGGWSAQDAEFITTACNSHLALVEMLEKALNIIQSHSDTRGCYDCDDAYKEIIARLDKLGEDEK